MDAPDGADVAFFGVYDGHGGADVAQCVASQAAPQLSAPASSALVLR